MNFVSPKLKENAIFQKEVVVEDSILPNLVDLERDLQVLTCLYLCKYVLKKYVLVLILIEI